MTKDDKSDERKFRFDLARWDARFDKRVDRDAWHWLARYGFYPQYKQWPIAKKGTP